jgi:RHS repeat-associated protein
MVVNNVVKLYYHLDHLGTTDFLTDNTKGDVASYVTYDDWGALTAKAVLKMGVRELDLVQDYTGHPYDMVLGLYYAKARMYDADDRRFMAVDPVKGWIGNPQTLVQYTYCLNNPIIFIDPLGLDLIWITAEGSAPVNFPLIGEIKFGHTSALVQDSNDEWHYFYWGASHAILEKIDGFDYTLDNGYTYKVDPMGDLNNFNLWLESVLRPHEYKGTADYTKATYIKGDYTKAYEYFKKLICRFGGTDDNGKYIQSNEGYNQYIFNCKDATLSGVLAANPFFMSKLTHPGFTPNAFAKKVEKGYGNTSFTKP